MGAGATWSGEDDAAAGVLTLGAGSLGALVLAATRRLMRPADAPPLGTIRSLAYFLPVIEEVLNLHVGPGYFDYLRQKLERAGTPR